MNLEKVTTQRLREYIALNETHIARHLEAGELVMADAHAAQNKQFIAELVRRGEAMEQ